jgi:Rap1a immunity proteins
MAGSRGYLMRIILVFCLVLACASTIRAATPTKSQQKAAPISLSIRTAGELGDACTTPPADRVSFARLSFCNGFAQGVLQTDSQNPNGAKICLPRPSPKRSETMKEFAGWVRADPSRKDELPSVAFLQFMAGRFPCT